MLVQKQAMRLLQSSSQKLSIRALSSTPTKALNINNGLKKDIEGAYFSDLATQPSTVLQGIGPKHAEYLDVLGLSTVEKLAKYKFFHLAKSLVALSKLEEAGGRLDGSSMNINKGLDKNAEHLSLVEIIQQPPEVLQGISPTKAEALGSLGVKTVEDLASLKYCLWAESICTAAEFEEK